MKFCAEGSRAAGFGHLGPFSKTARMGRVSGFGEAEMDRVGKTMKQCLSLSMLNTVPEIVTLARILQAPTGSSGDTATGLNLILAYVRTKEKPPKKKGSTYVYNVTHQFAAPVMLGRVFDVVKLAIRNDLHERLEFRL